MSAAPKPSLLAVMAGHLETLAKRLVALEQSQPKVTDLERRIAALESKANGR